MIFFENKIKHLIKIDKIIKRLEVQKTRILNLPNKIHDADYYTILLRRGYRIIEDEASKNPQIANLKGKNNNLFNKIKIRDHFEHNAKTKSELSNKELNNFRIVSAGSSLNINIRTSIAQKKDVSISILSGNITWDLTKDHQSFIKILEEVAKLRIATKS